MSTPRFSTRRPSFAAFALAFVLAAPALSAQPADALALNVVPVSARAASTAPAPATTADVVLATLWTNPTRAAAHTINPERSTADFARFALATTAATGAYSSHEVLGSASGEHGLTYTYARVHFDDASVLVRLTWKGTTLVTVTRGAEPALPAVLARQ